MVQWRNLESIPQYISYNMTLWALLSHSTSHFTKLIQMVFNDVRDALGGELVTQLQWQTQNWDPAVDCMILTITKMKLSNRPMTYHLNPWKSCIICLNLCRKPLTCDYANATTSTFSGDSNCCSMKLSDTFCSTNNNPLLYGLILTQSYVIYWCITPLTWIMKAWLQSGWFKLVVINPNAPDYVSNVCMCALIEHESQYAMIIWELCFWSGVLQHLILYWLW